MTDETKMMEITRNTGTKQILSFKEFHEFLEKNVLSEDQLRKLNFPRPHPTDHGKAKLYNLPHKFVATIRRQGERKCRFCGKFYPVDAAGNPTGKALCMYHPYSQPPPGKSYSCCRKAWNSGPCTSQNYHVTNDFNENDLTKFVCTKDLPERGSNKVYAFDCEFVYTNKGQELASITIIDHNEEVVLDSIVKPTTPIIDYLTLYSKLTAESFDNNCITDDEFCGKIQKIIGPDVILVGHGCSKDLLKMRVIHDNVVDTSSLYPHPLGAYLLQSLQTISEAELDEKALPTDCNKAFVDCVRTMRIAKVAACRVAACENQAK